MFKLSKVKGGRGGYIQKVNKLMGKGTPAVKKIDENELNLFEEENNFEEKNKFKGSGTQTKKYKKSIKPLVFKM